ncbi:MAG: DUF2889 domain-containing protein [Burkholderiaceae bacterium]|nr:DUF2889 domain-containing protein [Burkholderiaceae bacterium]
MPLPEAAPRKLLHLRTLEFYGFARVDGFWDIEGRLTDRKPFGHLNYRNEPLSGGAPVHDMSVRLTLNDELQLVAIEAATDASPFGGCHQVIPALQSLKGARLDVGWRQALKTRLPPSASCTHLSELLQATATVAFQTLGFGRTPEGTNPLLAMGSGETPPFFVDKCHSWLADGEVIHEVFPRFAKKRAP